jgi:hypothetical protein
VLSLDGDVFTIGSAGKGVPHLQIGLLRGSRTVVRVLVDEPMTLAEEREVIESFRGEINVDQGIVFSTAYTDADADEGDIDLRELGIPAGAYAVTVHATVAGPCAPAKIHGGTISDYYRRTRPGQQIPSWLRPDCESDDFWVGLIIRLESLPVGAKARPMLSRVHRPGMHARVPEVCPLGIQSLEPEGWKRFVQTDLPDVYWIRDLVGEIDGFSCPITKDLARSA